MTQLEELVTLGPAPAAKMTYVTLLLIDPIFEHSTPLFSFSFFLYIYFIFVNAWSFQLSSHFLTLEFYHSTEIKISVQTNEWVLKYVHK